MLEGLLPACGVGHALLSVSNVASFLAYTVVVTLACGVFMGRAASSKRKKGGKDEEAPLLTPLSAHWTSASKVARYEWIDSCRFCLVALVIVGHAVAFPCSYLPGSAYFLKPALVWAATFHMPGLAFLSGLCSKGPLTCARAKSLFAFVLMPFIFTYFSQWAFYCRAYGQCTLRSMDDGVEWYLMSLLQWRLAAASLMHLRPSVLLIVAFVIGILSGYCLNIFNVLCYVGDIPLMLGVTHRTLAFFPFFAVGLVVDPLTLQYVHNRWSSSQTAARILLIGGLLACFVQARFGSGLAHLELGAIGDFNYDYISPRINPEQPWSYLIPKLCGPEHNFAAIFRAGRYALSCVAVAAFCVATPKGPSWISEAGRHTMYPYLLHTWPVTVLSLFLVSHPFWSTWAIGTYGHGGWTFWIITAIIAMCFTYLTTLPLVRMIFAPLIEPEWLLRGGTSRADENGNLGLPQKGHAT